MQYLPSERGTASFSFRNISCILNSRRILKSYLSTKYLEIYRKIYQFNKNFNIFNYICDNNIYFILKFINREIYYQALEKFDMGSFC